MRLIHKVALRRGGWVALLAGLTLLACCASASASAPSDPDPSFGEGGYTSVQANKSCLRACVEFGGSYAEALALQPDGGIVLGGHNDYLGAFGERSASSPPGAIVGLLPDGRLDTSFGTEGVDELSLGVGALYTDGAGGLLALGETPSGASGAERLTASGVPDGMYGPEGVRSLPLHNVQRDRGGRLIGLVTVHVPASAYKGASTHLDLARLLPSGALDTHFGEHGYAYLPGSEEVESAALAITPDGSAIVALKPHSLSEEPRPSRLLLEHFAPSGELERAFGHGGIVRAPIRTLYGGGIIAVAPDGHILLALGVQRSYRSTGQLVVVQYTPHGRLDLSFGTDGVARIRLPGGRNYTGVEPEAIAFVEPDAIAFDAAGDAIVTGSHRAKTVDTPAGEGFIARFTSHGRDCAFGSEGILLDEHFGAINATAVQPNGRIIAAGWGHGKRFEAARYLGGPSRTCQGEPVR